MIVPVKKAQLFILNQDKEKTLKLLQKHAFFMLKENHIKQKIKSDRIHQIDNAIDILKPYTAKKLNPEFIVIDEENFESINNSWQEKVQHITELKQKRDELTEKCLKHQERIHILKPFETMNIPVADVKKIEQAEVYFGQVETKKVNDFLAALNQFEIQYEIFDEVNKETNVVLAHLKRRNIYQTLQLSGLDRHLNINDNILSELEALQYKIHHFEELKQTAMQIIHQVKSNYKGKKITSKVLVNEALIKEIIDLNHQRIFLTEEIKRLEEEIRILEPFESLTLPLYQLYSSQYFETQFGKIRKKARLFTELNNHPELVVTIFHETKQYVYVGITYLKQTAQYQKFTTSTEFEAIQLEATDKTIKELMKDKQQKISSFKENQLNIRMKLATYGDYLDEIKACTTIHEGIKQHIEQIILNIQHKSIFGTFNFSLRELLQLNYVKLFVSKLDSEKIEIQIQLSQKDLARIIFNDFSFQTIDIPAYVQKNTFILTGLEKELNSYQTQIEAIDQTLKQYAAQIDDLKIVYDKQVNIEKLDAIEYSETQYTEFLEGWIIESKVDTLKDTLTKEGIIYELDLVEPEADEIVPTALKNNAIVQPFEDITNMFTPPVSNEIDPNPAMSVWYWLIFGMMMGDIGYGLLMVILCSFYLLWKKPKGVMQSMLKVFAFSGISTIIMGILYGSFFGYDEVFGLKIQSIIPPELRINMIDQPLNMLILCMALGVIHILTGLVISTINSIRQKAILDALGGSIAWTLVLIGIPLFLLIDIPWIGISLVILGILLVVIFAGHSQKNVIVRLLSGIVSLYDITGFLGDILSYSRILALALSGAVIGSTMNMLAEMVIGMPFIGFIFAGIIYIVGHLFNFVMNMLSAYVHTGRLQYLEFFGKFYTGGGTIFNPYGLEFKYIYAIQNNKN